ncbi:hypothetical protein Ahy_A01g001208 [Arachis hypogaea]|uniref:Uncharacterized protein n=1 Tax=Arachis hypogaea TaxID=3818 RepID=A0A445EME1_ARAHY|nr:hypothetical protein Ahy_A01g001208 [Arachis hypogaea]
MALANCLTSISLALTSSRMTTITSTIVAPVTTSTTSLISRHHRCTLLHHHHFPDPVVTSIVSVITTFVLTATLILSASASTSASASPPPLAPLRPRPLPPRRRTIPNPSHQTPFPIPVPKNAKIPAALEYLGTFIELSIKAGGVGLTLTAASTVIFAEQSWTPSDLIRPMIVLIELARDVVQFKPDNLGQMLDAHENTLAVSNNQPLSNPAKHTTIGHSPSKQRTLDQNLI